MVKVKISLLKNESFKLSILITVLTPVILRVSYIYRWVLIRYVASFLYLINSSSNIFKWPSKFINKYLTFVTCIGITRIGLESLMEFTCIGATCIGILYFVEYVFEVCSN